MPEIKDIAKQPLVVWGGQTVITTAQLAEVYGATTNNIKDNFSRNKDRFTEGKHYILLTGQDLKEFKNQAAESDLVAKNTSQLYLWTRRGASRHCKILGTDKAWEQFDYLEENYFERKSTPQLLRNPMELLELHYQAIKQVDGKAEKALTGVEELKEQFNTFEKSLPLLPNEADEVSNAVKKRVIEVLGGKTAPAYKDRKICQRVFIDAYRELKRNFNVGRYKDIKREQKAQAVEVAGRYEPPLYLKEQIEQANAQMKLNLGEQEDRNEQ